MAIKEYWLRKPGDRNTGNGFISDEDNYSDKSNRNVLIVYYTSDKEAQFISCPRRDARLIMRRLKQYLDNRED